MPPKLLIADKNNKIFEVDGLGACGMKAGNFYCLEPEDLIRLPYGSELFALPDRSPVGFDGKGFVKEKGSAVAAFVSPGYTSAFSAAYIENKRAGLLPLFSYSAVCWHKGACYVPAVRVDMERRQDLRLMDFSLIRRNVKKFKKLYPKNRLIRHLETCACKYGCPAGRNFFLQRYEAPLPASTHCNSACFGCISVRHSKTCPETQPRIKFTPTPQEIAEAALHHIHAVKKPVVSFGQGCEGEPLTVWRVLEKAIKLIRQRTQKGVINLNTNGSLPEAIKRLRNAGLDSIRVSLNSAREVYYDRYYHPKNYRFRDVMRSISAMKRLGGFVWLNYLIMPGFSDRKDEVGAFWRLLSKGEIDMIQWRNLNYDPMDYFRRLGIEGIKSTALLGIKFLIDNTKRRFPGIGHGYFNPRFLH